MTALVRGDVHMAVLPAIAVTPQADIGKVNIIAVSLPKRSPYLSNIPTLKESGVDVEADTWMGLIVPGATSPALIAAIQKDVVEALAGARRARQARNTIYGGGRQFAGRIPRGDRRRNHALVTGHQER